MTKFSHSNPVVFGDMRLRDVFATVLAYKEISKTDYSLYSPPSGGRRSQEIVDIAVRAADQLCERLGDLQTNPN